MNLHDDVMEILGNRYEREIWEDVISNPFYDPGMLVYIHGKKVPCYGRIINHLGFNKRAAMHRYDVELIDSSIVEACFECDLEKIKGWQLRCIDGGVK